MNLGPLTLDNLFEDSQTMVPIKGTAPSLAELQAVGKQIQDIDNLIMSLEERLKIAKEQREHLSEQRLPDLMAALQLKSFTLEDGTVFETAQMVSASIKEDKREDAHAWLRARGLGDIIKNEVITTFGAGEDEDAQRLMETVRDLSSEGKINYGKLDRVERVHPQTLKSMVKDRLAKGQDLDVELLGIFIKDVAVMKMAKKR